MRDASRLDNESGVLRRILYIGKKIFPEKIYSSIHLQ